MSTKDAASAVENLPPFVNEPITDFSRAVHRDAMSRALADVKKQLGKNYDLWIDGQMISLSERIPSVNPADNNTVVGYVAKAGIEHADQAVEAAAKAFPKWRDTPVRHRANVLFDIAQKMRERRFELNAWIIFETGKQWREADGDVAEAIDFCEYYARHMLQLEQPRFRNQPGEDNSYFYTPRGVCVVISPWNFPLAIMCGMAMAPLVAGCTVILKPAEQSAVIGAKFAELLRELDLPPGVVNFVPGLGEEVGARMVEHKDMAVINFTGSVPVGLSINKSAATMSEGQNHVKRVLAEMGGKNAVIIDNDADLDEAVKGVVGSAFGYQGQKCSACSGAIVLPQVYDAFVNRLRDAVASLTVGPPEDPTYSVGPVIDREAFDRLNKVIADTKASSQCLVATDTSALTNVGNFIGPHVFGDVKPTDFIAQNELFGPVLAVMKAKDLTDALQIANGTKYALTGGLFSRNPQTIARVRKEFLVGNLYINRKVTGAEVDRQPFGGFKLSGIGAKAGGPDYLHQFLYPRAITENTLRRGFAPE